VIGKLHEVHLQYAMALEDEGHFEKAEVEFIAAQKPREAIDMFVHQREWERAVVIATNHDPAALPVIYTAQGGDAEERNDLVRKPIEILPLFSSFFTLFLLFCSENVSLNFTEKSQFSAFFP
jgi:hypothetical protein